MKIQLIQKVRIWAVSAVLLAGVLYSMLALKTEPVYASSCDCVEALQDGKEFCASRGGVKLFSCNPTQSSFFVECNDSGQLWDLPCSF
jgi:hypothetical protein